MELNEYCDFFLKRQYNFNYDTYAIPDFLNGYIHLYWIEPQNFSSNNKCMGRCSIE